MNYPRLLLFIHLTSAYCILFAGCGLKESKYKSYETHQDSSDNNSSEGGETQQTGSTSDCSAGLEAFTTYVSSAMSTCATAGCHLSTRISGSVLKSGDDSHNRTVLLTYDDSGDGSVLFNKISGTHGGGDQSSVLTSEMLASWKSTESDCP